jgi:hypothetical protein
LRSLAVCLKTELGDEGSIDQEAIREIIETAEATRDFRLRWCDVLLETARELDLSV